MARQVNTRSKKARAARIAVALLRYNQLAWAAGLADNKGIADATQDTLEALPALFKEPWVIEKATMRRLYGPNITPT